MEVRISDLLDVVHQTIIKKYGDNEIILEELKSIDEKIQSGKLLDLDVSDVTFWKHIVSNITKT